MTTPWEVLGIAPQADEQQIRRAYARLLKAHRPDQDPEGFRRVRDAYEALQAAADRPPLAAAHEPAPALAGLPPGLSIPASQAGKDAADPGPDEDALDAAARTVIAATSAEGLA